MKSTKIGFIGIGVMGDPMVKNLLKAGFEVTVYDIVSAKTADVVKAGAKRARSNAELAADSDVVIVMVNDTDAARRAVFGRKGIWETIRPGSTVIFMCTIAPEFCQEVEEKGKKKGVNVLDVAVSGAGQPVKDGTLTFLAGGDKALLKKHEPVLMAMGNKIFYMGGVGMGEVAKICHNYIVTVTNAVLADAIKMASKSGLNLDTLHRAFLSTTANSGSLQRNWNTLTKETVKPGEKVIRRYSRNLYKDLRLAMALAEKHGLRLPIAGVTSQVDLSRYVPAKTA